MSTHTVQSLNRLARYVTPVLLALAVGILVGSLLTVAGANAAHAAKPQHPVYMCDTDEAGEGQPGPLPCVWDARHMGNGKGRSFIVRRDLATVRVTHRRAHSLLCRRGAR